MAIVVMRVYKFRGEYMLVMKGRREDVIAATRAFARDHGATLEWDDKMDLGQLVGLDEVYCMLTPT